MTAPHPRRYSEEMSSSIEKGHGWLLVAVCTSLFFMPFMMAGVNAVLPPLGHAIGLTDHEFGLWAGLAVDNTAETTATGYLFSDEAGKTAVLT